MTEPVQLAAKKKISAICGILLQKLSLKKTYS